MTEQEFQTFLRSIRPADRAAMDAAARRQAELAKPPGSLGALEDVSIRLAGLTGRVKNRIDRCRVLVFAADNGVTANVHYKPLPMLTAYKQMGFDIKAYPNAYNMYKNEITLPLNTVLTDEQAAYTAQLLLNLI